MTTDGAAPSPLLAVDLYAGAGGATVGLMKAGFAVLGAVENDLDAAASYRLNHPCVELWEADIRTVSAAGLSRTLGLARGELTLLKACPPCQGFSSLAEGRSAPDASRNDLVGETIRFVRALRPSAVMLENVPGLGRDRRSRELRRALTRLGYASREYLVDAVDFGVPQRRRRLILLALRGLRSRLPDSVTSHLPNSMKNITVRNAFNALAKAIDHNDPLNIARSPSPKVLTRIRAIPVGGTRYDLPEELRLACHGRADSRSRNATASYGRLKLDAPAPTMTTRCTTPACGSFIHPTEDRGITLREAATLQTFPVKYKFAGKYGSIERQIGNAVPVKMAAALGQTVAALVHDSVAGS